MLEGAWACTGDAYVHHGSHVSDFVTVQCMRRGVHMWVHTCCMHVYTAVHSLSHLGFHRAGHIGLLYGSFCLHRDMGRRWELMQAPP